MSITRDILQKLNESAEVKKTYGDKPQEGKKESIKKGKASKVPRGKVDNKIKAEKLQNSNSQAADIYTNDTEKLMDKIDSKEQSDKGKVAKTTGTKSDKTIKFPFGDKVQASDSKLIKEGKDFEDCKDKITEDYDNGTWMKYQHMIEGTLESAKEDMDEDAFLDFLSAVYNIISKYNNGSNQFECASAKSCKKEDK